MAPTVGKFPQVGVLKVAGKPTPTCHQYAAPDTPTAYLPSGVRPRTSDVVFVPTGGTIIRLAAMALEVTSATTVATMNVRFIMIKLLLGAFDFRQPHAF
jgi:hypothetical protein